MTSKYLLNGVLAMKLYSFCLYTRNKYAPVPIKHESERSIIMIDFIDGQCQFYKVGDTCVYRKIIPFGLNFCHNSSKVNAVKDV